jgi:hypothetical protein
MTLKAIRKYMGDSTTSIVVEKYDCKMVMVLFIQVYKHLHPTSALPIEPTPTTNDDLFFGQFMSSDDVMHSLLKNEFHMYRCLWVNFKGVEYPLM